MDALIVLCTCPDAETAARLAATLVEERLAACVNCIAGIASTYRWNGALTTGEETLLLIKTTNARYAALQTRIVELHPYELPEVLAIAASEGLAPYLAWLARETRPA